MNFSQRSESVEVCSWYSTVHPETFWKKSNSPVKRVPSFCSRAYHGAGLASRAVTCTGPRERGRQWRYSLQQDGYSIITIAQDWLAMVNALISHSYSMSPVCIINYHKSLSIITTHYELMTIDIAINDHELLPKNRLSLARHDPGSSDSYSLSMGLFLSIDCNKQPIPGKIIHWQMETMQLLEDFQWLIGESWWSNHALEIHLNQRILVGTKLGLKGLTVWPSTTLVSQQKR